MDAAPRTWLYVPGHREPLVARAFERGADAVVLDLEDAVPPDQRPAARRVITAALADGNAWVRVSRAGSDDCARDLDAVAGAAVGIRLAKAESAADVEWVRDRAPGLRVDCLVETARGVLAASELAQCDDVVHLSFGSVDLAADLRVADAWQPLFRARTELVLAARAAGLNGPSDGVHVHLDDPDGLRRSALAARRLGFSGKSVIHPSQVEIVNDVFRPSDAELEWARLVMAAFSESGGHPTTVEGGEFVDAAVAARAAALLALGDG